MVSTFCESVASIDCLFAGAKDYLFNGYDQKCVLFLKKMSTGLSLC